MKKIIVGVIIGSFFLGGCASVPKKRSGLKDLSKADSYRFKDIPVPSDFESLPFESHVFEAGDVRGGVLKYRGESMPMAITKFYRKAMPKYNWRILNIVEGGETVMNFIKGKEICTVKFHPHNNKANLMIIFSPYSSQPRKKNRIKKDELD